MEAWKILNVFLPGNYISYNNKKIQSTWLECQYQSMLPLKLQVFCFFFSNLIF